MPKMTIDEIKASVAAEIDRRSDDLIDIAKSLKRRRNADFSRLKSLLPELERLNNMIGMKRTRDNVYITVQ